jgi:hypothetical protein
VRLSEHFTLRELTRSQTASRLGLDNTPNREQVDALCMLCANVLEPVRSRFGPFTPSSGFRSNEVNRRAGGSRNSAHRRGEAADFEVVGVSNLELAEWIRDSGLHFDQLILEFYTPGDPSSGWVHCSYRAGANRRQCLTAIGHPGEDTEYREGLTP